VASAKEGGGEPVSSAAQPSADPQGGGEGDEATYLELIKKAIKQRQKQQKLVLLLGPDVPPLPPKRMLA